MQNHGLGSWLPKRRQSSPDKVALVYGDGREMTYRQLADFTDAMSGLLAEHGIRKGDRVAFIG